MGHKTGKQNLNENDAVSLVKLVALILMIVMILTLV